MPTAPPLTLSSAAGRRLLAACVAGSGMVFLDGTIANVALPRIGQDMHASLAQLQWVINAYTLTLAGLIIVGGSLGDRLGRKRVYVWGVWAFALASAAVAASPTAGLLIAARLVQGVAAALLTPGSLAILQSSFAQGDRLRAIGAWSGMLGAATAAGPVVGGFFVSIDWRLGFLINVPLALVVLWLLRPAPETRDEGAAGGLDVPGMLLAPTALAGLTWALTGWGDPASVPGGRTGVLAAAGVAALAAVAFVLAERRGAHPMLPLSIFSSRAFSAVNLATLFVYAGFTGAGLFLTLFLQTTAGYSPLAAGAATVPVSLVMLGLSGYFGGVANRRGPRGPMVAGMLTVAAALLWLGFAPSRPNYPVHLLPPLLLQGLGMSLLVSPLTGVALAAAPERYSGIASGVSNAVSRTAGLIAVAALPLLVGLSGAQYAQPAAVALAFSSTMGWCAGALVMGAAITLWGLRGYRAPAPEGSDA
ncbi:MFS transporter [Brevibacterium sp. 5221]|uniref:MFS transporter n=1 Tax=Brevibacterium rongguiense TaxID=2695267 RepID=A0A6N9H745_9MICO|nr:MFS transporter [Brevibacterium rongguiense]MYM19860.1 MFS transporter [Brevibacterium rongguiense]